MGGAGALELVGHGLERHLRLGSNLAAVAVLRAEQGLWLSPRHGAGATLPDLSGRRLPAGRRSIDL
jgi:hypothetical protein